MTEVTMYLEKTNANQFIRWLASYAYKRHVENKKYPFSENAHFHFHWYNPPPNGNAYNLSVNIIKVDELVKPEGDKNEVKVNKQPDVIKLEWLEVGERLKVIISYYSARWIFLPIIDLINDINKDWTIFEGDFINGIVAQAKKFDFDITVQYPPSIAEKEQWLSRDEVGEAMEINPLLRIANLNFYINWKIEKYQNDIDRMLENSPELIKELSKQQRTPPNERNETDKHNLSTEEKSTKKSKRGPRRYSVAEKIEAVEQWDKLDRDKFPVTLDEWLEEKFGTTGGVLNVAVSTFHGWRKLKK